MHKNAVPISCSNIFDKYYFFSSFTLANICHSIVTFYTDKIGLIITLRLCWQHSCTVSSMSKVTYFKKAHFYILYDHGTVRLAQWWKVE